MIRARFDRWVKDRTLAACFGAVSAAARMSRAPLPSTADVAVFTYWCGELSALAFLAHVTGTSRRTAQADRDAAAAADDLDDCDAEPTPARGTPLGGLGIKPLRGAAVATGEDAGGWSSHDVDGTTVRDGAAERARAELRGVRQEASVKTKRWRETFCVSCGLGDPDGDEDNERPRRIAVLCEAIAAHERGRSASHSEIETLRYDLRSAEDALWEAQAGRDA